MTDEDVAAASQLASGNVAALLPQEGRTIAEAARAPFHALVTIDEIYPDRPDRT